MDDLEVPPWSPMYFMKIVTEHGIDFPLRVPPPNSEAPLFYAEQVEWQKGIGASRLHKTTTERRVFLLQRSALTGRYMYIKTRTHVHTRTHTYTHTYTHVHTPTHNHP